MTFCAVAAAAAGDGSNPPLRCRDRLRVPQPSASGVAEERGRSMARGAPPPRPLRPELLLECGFHRAALQAGCELTGSLMPHCQLKQDFPGAGEAAGRGTDAARHAAWAFFKEGNSCPFLFLSIRCKGLKRSQLRSSCLQPSLLAGAVPESDKPPQLDLTTAERWR